MVDAFFAQLPMFSSLPGDEAQENSITPDAPAISTPPPRKRTRRKSAGSQLSLSGFDN